MYVSESPSASVAVSVICNSVFSSVETDWSSAMGLSLTGTTAIDIVAGSLSAMPSFALKVKKSSPLKSGSGV